MSFAGLLANRVLITGLIAWSLAQVLKLPVEYLKTREWNWGLLISPGGMPSSHSALVSSIALACGLYVGFDSAIFALAVAIAMVVSYDASGIRRQAGIQAQRINILINEIFSGQPISQKNLKEVLGHTRLEVTGGILLGLAVALVLRLMWP